MDEGQIRLEARLAAIEHLLTKMLAAMTHQVPIDQLDQLLERYGQGLETMTIEGLNAAQSDLLSSEVRDEVLRLLNAVREVRTRGL